MPHFLHFLQVASPALHSGSVSKFPSSQYQQQRPPPRLGESKYSRSK